MYSSSERTWIRCSVDVPPEEEGKPLEIGRRYILTVTAADQSEFIVDPLYKDAKFERGLSVSFSTDSLDFEQAKVVLAKRDENVLPSVEVGFVPKKAASSFSVFVCVLLEHELVQITRFNIP